MVIAVAAIFVGAVLGAVVLVLGALRTARTSPISIALKFTCAFSRLYLVDELVVTVSVPVKVRSVIVEPLICVTVPVAPPQKPPPKNAGPPKPPPLNPPPPNAPPHAKLDPPRGPKDGLCVEGDGLGLLEEAVVFASAGAPAR